MRCNLKLVLRDGLLDRRWWRDFAALLKAQTRVTTIAIEHEDPFVKPELGSIEAAAVLACA